MKMLKWFALKLLCSKVTSVVKTLNWAASVSDEQLEPWC